MTTTAILPDSLISRSDPASPATGCVVHDTGLGTGRTLSYGTTPGLNVAKSANLQATIAAGAPGTTTVDLGAAVSANGTLLGAGTTKIVVIDIRSIPVSPAVVPNSIQLRKSAANPLAINAGVTDASNLGATRILLEWGTDAPTFDGTHKNVDIESTLGATVEIVALAV